MKCEFVIDEDTFLVLPSIVVTKIKCENPNCEAVHGVALAAGWLIFSIVFYLDDL